MGSRKAPQECPADARKPQAPPPPPAVAGGVTIADVEAIAERAGERLVREEREVNAALVDAAGCICDALEHFRGIWKSRNDEHYAECPRALAAAIRARGGAA